MILSSVFSLGFFIGKESQKPILIDSLQNQTLGKPENVDFSLFWEVWKRTEEKFIASNKLDYQKMLYGAISGMIKSLKDPYTVFMNPEDSKRFLEDVSGKFEGIGAEIGIRRDILTIIAPLKNTPAEQAGLRAGDKIIKIDEKTTTDLTIEEAVTLIRGPRGTEVALTILRDGMLETKEIKVMRDVIEIPSLKLSSVEEGGKVQDFQGLEPSGIAHLSLYQFSEKSVQDIKKSAQDILKSKTKGIILDLRNNPGGYLEVAQDIAGLFMEKNTLVAIEEFSDGSRKEYRTQESPVLLGFPMVALVNQGSASASEILAGALRENRGINLIGEKTFGKGSVQELERLRGDSSLKITVAKWLLPSGYSINERGIEPDIKVEMTPEDYDEGKDPQLEKAIEILNKL